MNRSNLYRDVWIVCLHNVKKKLQDAQAGKLTGWQVDKMTSWQDWKNTYMIEWGPYCFKFGNYQPLTDSLIKPRVAKKSKTQTGEATGYYGQECPACGRHPRIPYVNYQEWPAEEKTWSLKSVVYIKFIFHLYRTLDSNLSISIFQMNIINKTSLLKCWCRLFLLCSRQGIGGVCKVQRQKVSPAFQEKKAVWVSAA